MHGQKNIKNSQILRSIMFSFQIRAVYEVMRINILERVRPHITIGRMRTTLWIS